VGVNVPSEAVVCACRSIVCFMKGQYNLPWVEVDVLIEAKGPKGEMPVWMDPCIGFQ
jgi:hypothetical protein